MLTMNRSNTLHDMMVELKSVLIGIVDDGHPIVGMRRDLKAIQFKLERTKLAEVTDMTLVPTPTAFNPYLKPRLTLREVLDLLTIVTACV